MIIEVIGDTIENRIIDFLIEGRGIDYTKSDIAKNCRISRPTLYKVFSRLEKEKIVKPSRIIGRVQLYSLNENNERIKALLKLEEFLLKNSFEEEKPKILSRTGSFHLFGHDKKQPLKA